jgi:hypothetical protein
MTWTLVPALAGSTPIFWSPKGSAVPVSTDVITIKNSDIDIANAFMMLPFVAYTRTNPPTGQPPQHLSECAVLCCAVLQFSAEAVQSAV